MVKKGSKYFNLLSQKLKSRKQGLRNLKYLLLSLVCQNSSIANHQLDQLIKNYFSYSAKGLNILDMGSGFCNYYPENVIESKNEYFACDLSCDLKEVLEKRGIKFIQGDMVKDKLTLKENSFDIIIVITVFEHLPNPYAVAQTLLKSLEEGGLIYEDFCADDLHSGETSELISKDTSDPNLGIARIQRGETIGLFDEKCSLLFGDYGTCSKRLWKCQ